MSTTPFSLFVGFVVLNVAALAAPTSPDSTRAELHPPAVRAREAAHPVAVPERMARPASPAVPSNPRVNPASAPQRSAAAAGVRWALYRRAGAVRPPLVVSGDARSRFNWY
ncbi:MAG TPA: hypothetical protein VGL42_13200 [Opitutaceae bacterium]|jgi:hypothetical protein